MTKKESQNGSTMGINHYTINEKVSKTREEYRSRGLGMEFFSFIEEKNSGKIARLRLEVEEENTRAISLYKRLGYEVLDYKQMVKELK